MDLLKEARNGDASAAGVLLERCRNYLNLVARTQLEHALAVRADASDIVQETFLEAHRDLHRFKGSSEHELLAWLRTILNRNLIDQIRYHGAQRRDWRRDGSLELMVEQSSAAIHAALGLSTNTPGQKVIKKEQSLRFADALEQLKAEYREVIVLRNLLGMTHTQVAEKLGRTEGAVRMLWVRALEALKSELKD